MAKHVIQSIRYNRPLLCRHLAIWCHMICQMIQFQLFLTARNHVVLVEVDHHYHLDSYHFSHLDRMHNIDFRWYHFGKPVPSENFSPLLYYIHLMASSIMKFWADHLIIAVLNLKMKINTTLLNYYVCTQCLNKMIKFYVRLADTLPQPEIIRNVWFNSYKEMWRIMTLFFLWYFIPVTIRESSLFMSFMSVCRQAGSTPSMNWMASFTRISAMSFFFDPAEYSGCRIIPYLIFEMNYLM